MLGEIVSSLSLRKEHLFPYDRRLIVDCKVAMGPKGYHVTVVSASTA